MDEETLTFSGLRGIKLKAQRYGPVEGAPVLIVRGGESNVLSRETMAHLREVLHHVAQAEIPGARHMIAGDDNARFNAAIRTFLLANARNEEVAR